MSALSVVPNVGVESKIVKVGGLVAMVERIRGGMESRDDHNIRRKIFLQNHLRRISVRHSVRTRSMGATDVSTFGVDFCCE
jgi:hypothetical protein